MKVLFLGVYRDGTGWGHAAIDYILALDKAGLDVVCKPIKLNNMDFPIPERVQELENKDARGSDVVIQYILPHMMEYSGHFKKNIAMFEIETDNFKHNIWPECINMMDEAWLTSSHALDSCKNSLVNIPQKVVLHAADVSKYSKEYKHIDIPGVDGDFIFYTICDINNRKNLSALIRAYHTEFDPSEPVSLVIKSSKYGVHHSVVSKELQKFCNDIKEGLKLYPDIASYKSEILVPNVVDDDNIYSLHKACNCFVSSSCAEGWCIPAFDAMAFGNTPIVTDWSGFRDYVDNQVGWLVESYPQQALGGSGNFHSIYTGRESWHVVNIRALGKAMRECYENEKLRNSKSEEGKRRALEFSHEKIGQKLRKILEQ